MKNKLNELRGEIDNINTKLIKLLAKRFDITKKIGKLKAKHNFTPVDEKREKQQTDKVKKIAKTTGVNEMLVEKIFHLITKQAVREHRQIKQQHKQTKEKNYGYKN